MHSPLVVEKFQIYSVKITANAFVSQKIFTHASKQHSPPGFYHYLPGRRELPIPPKSGFWRYFLKIMELKKQQQQKKTQVSATSFDKFHHLCNLYIFGLCFVLQWFSFKHTEVWRFFNLTNKIFSERYDVQEELH